MYDIRQSSGIQILSDLFVSYLNLPSTQEALGVEKDFVYQMSSDQVYSVFQQSGDYIFGEPLQDLGYLLDRGIRVVRVLPFPAPLGCANLLLASSMAMLITLEIG